MTAKNQLWDLPVRLFHWSLLPLILCQWLLAENSEALHDQLAERGIEFDAMLWHARFGFILLFLLSFRLVWGFVGSTSARFSSFVKGPKQVLAYTKTLMNPLSVRHAGHNPLGGWMVLLLLTLITAQIFSGLFLSDDVMFEAPFYALVSEDTVEWFEEWHELNFNLILLAVIAHVAAIIFYAKHKKQFLVPPMLTGQIDLPYQNQHPYSMMKPFIIALITVIPVLYLSSSYW
jgi:cytochrome b